MSPAPSHDQSIWTDPLFVGDFESLVTAPMDSPGQTTCMLKAFLLLPCAAGAVWLVHVFGFGMLVALGALAAAALLLGGPVPELEGSRSGPPAGDRTTAQADLQWRLSAREDLQSQ